MGSLLHAVGQPIPADTAHVCCRQAEPLRIVTDDAPIGSQCVASNVESQCWVRRRRGLGTQQNEDGLPTVCSPPSFFEMGTQLIE